MKNVSLRPALLVLFVTATGLTSCNKDEAEVPTPALTAQTASNVAALGTARHYTFYSLANNVTVPYTDSASTKWDVAFRGTTVLINAGTSGPGQGGAQVVTGLFEEKTTAPTADYRLDTATEKAIKTGSGNGWYSYDATTHIITPIAGKVLMIRTATGKYARLEVTSYYENAPASPTLTDKGGYYSFRYVYQPDGSTSLK